MSNLRARRWLYGLLLSLLASGIALFAMQEWVRVDGPFGPQPHALQIWLLRLHGALAMAGLLALGAVFAGHVMRRLPERDNRRTGLAALALLVGVIASGYGLYYGNDTVRTVSRWTHLVLGFAALPSLLWHIRAGMRSRRLRQRRRSRVQQRNAGPAYAQPKRPALGGSLLR